MKTGTKILIGIGIFLGLAMISMAIYFGTRNKPDTGGVPLPPLPTAPPSTPPCKEYTNDEVKKLCRDKFAWEVVIAPGKYHTDYNKCLIDPPTRC